MRLPVVALTAFIGGVVVSFTLIWSQGVFDKPQHDFDKRDGDAVLGRRLQASSAAFDRSACSAQIELDGVPVDHAVEDNNGGWHLFAKAVQQASSGAQVLHTVTATAIPCGGFLRPEHFYIRGAAATDHRIASAVLIDHEFSFLDGLLDKAPATILDLGANCGLTAAYFGSRYPGASVAALEPSSKNFVVASLNTYNAPNVNLIWGAVWGDTRLVHIDKSTNRNGEWAYSMQPLPPSEALYKPIGEAIPAYTVEGVMHKMRWDCIEFMKVDCECGEFELFNESTDPNGWIQNVKCLSMELHRWCGKDPRIVLRALHTAGFEDRHKIGELILWCRPEAEWGNRQCLQ